MLHTHPFNCPFSGTTQGLPILLKQETVSGSGISWAIYKSAHRSRQITMPAPHHSVFLQAGCPSCHPTNSVKALKAKASLMLQSVRNHGFFTYTLHHVNKILSHTRTMVRDCCEGDDQSLWERGKFDPLPPKNPSTDGHGNLCRSVCITSVISTTIQNFIQIGLGVSVLRMRDFAQ